MVKVFLTGGESIGWALDEDLRLLRECLQGIVSFTSLADAEVVHSVWWEAILEIPAHSLVGKRIISHTSNDPAHYIKQPSFARVRERVGQWITRSNQATRVLRELGVSSECVTYSVDTNLFYPLVGAETELTLLRDQLGIAKDAYVIGNFHRDSEGANLKIPKKQKAAEVFAGICRALLKRGNKIHVLLAGPRRHWLRKQLQADGVPFSFFGELIEDRDDIGINILPRDILRILYNVCDLHLLSSRWEGGPHSIMEAAACKIKIVSSRVGLAEDILEEDSLFEDPQHAIEIIELDIKNNSLEKTVQPQFDRVLTNHQTPALTEGFKKSTKMF